jgi:hypothetical protein
VHGTNEVLTIRTSAIRLPMALCHNAIRALRCAAVQSGTVAAAAVGGVALNVTTDVKRMPMASASAGDLFMPI